METANLIAIFGWMSVINLSLFVWGLLKMTVFRSLAERIGRQVFGPSIDEWFNHAPSILMVFYILIVVFNVVPYLAMRFVLL